MCQITILEHRVHGIATLLKCSTYNDDQSKKCSQAFADALQQHGAKADLFLYEGKTHTDLFLQVAIVSRFPNLLYFLIQ